MWSGSRSRSSHRSGPSATRSTGEAAGERRLCRSRATRRGARHPEPPRGAERVQRGADRHLAWPSRRSPRRRLGPAGGRLRRGAVFCAGADIDWQRASSALSMEENEADAARLPRCAPIDECPVPVIAARAGCCAGRRDGRCAAVADVTLARPTRLRLHRAKLGLMPAVISPFVLAADRRGRGPRPFPDRRAVRIQRALRIGLVSRSRRDSKSTWTPRGGPARRRSFPPGPRPGARRR